MDNRPFATDLKPTIYQKLIEQVAEICTCPECEEGRWIKKLANLLPLEPRRELLGWYNALIDQREMNAMTRANMLEQCRDWIEILESDKLK